MTRREMSDYKQPFEEALRYRDLGRLAEAEDLLRALVTEQDQRPEAKLMLGGLYFDQERRGSRAFRTVDRKVSGLRDSFALSVSIRYGLWIGAMRQSQKCGATSQATSHWNITVYAKILKKKDFSRLTSHRLNPIVMIGDCDSGQAGLSAAAALARRTEKEEMVDSKRKSNYKRRLKRRSEFETLVNCLASSTIGPDRLQ